MAKKKKKTTEDAISFLEGYIPANQSDSFPQKQPINPQIKQQDFISGLINIGTRVLASVFTTGVVTNTMYTVPAGKILYITSLNMNGFNNNLTGNEDVILFVNSEAVFDLVVHFGTAENLSISLTFPIVLNEGEKIKVQTFNVNVACQPSIQGYLVDRSLLPLFT